jgi:F0F1-type ATP synthase assembly protein I
MFMAYNCPMWITVATLVGMGALVLLIAMKANEGSIGSAPGRVIYGYADPYSIDSY